MVRAIARAKQRASGAGANERPIGQEERTWRSSLTSREAISRSSEHRRNRQRSGSGSFDGSDQASCAIGGRGRRTAEACVRFLGAQSCFRSDPPSSPLRTCGKQGDSPQLLQEDQPTPPDAKSTCACDCTGREGAGHRAPPQPRLLQAVGESTRHRAKKHLLLLLLDISPFFPLLTCGKSVASRAIRRTRGARMPSSHSTRAHAQRGPESRGGRAVVRSNKLDATPSEKKARSPIPGK